MGGRVVENAEGKGSQRRGGDQKQSVNGTHVRIVVRIHVPILGIWVIHRLGDWTFVSGATNVRYVTVCSLTLRFLDGHIPFFW